MGVRRYTGISIWILRPIKYSLMAPGTFGVINGMLWSKPLNILLKRGFAYIFLKYLNALYAVRNMIAEIRMTMAATTKNIHGAYFAISIMRQIAANFIMTMNTDANGTNVHTGIIRISINAKRYLTRK